MATSFAGQPGPGRLSCCLDIAIFTLNWTPKQEAFWSQITHAAPSSGVLWMATGAHDPCAGHTPPRLEHHAETSLRFAGKNLGRLNA